MATPDEVIEASRRAFDAAVCPELAPAEWAAALALAYGRVVCAEGLSKRHAIALVTVACDVGALRHIEAMIAVATNGVPEEGMH